uniref:DNA-directed RNA polymerase n=1 Tax=Ditylenchus dipsaci TaxID=166011 RepID=A0A915EIV6_9BILA
MERDALIAHGTAFCLQDRLFNCSDKDEAYMCAGCGSIVSVTNLDQNMAMFKRVESAFKAQNRIEKESNYHNFTRRHCSVCKRDDQVFLVNVPRVFRYLCAELSAVNVKVQLGVSHPKDIKR